MPSPQPKGYAYNRTRATYLATRLAMADTYWLRLFGLMGRDPATFPAGSGMWFMPSKGVHTLAMRFPIDVIHLDRDRVVVGVKENLKPWRVGTIGVKTDSVLELPRDTVRASGTRVGDVIEIGTGEMKEKD